MVNPIDAASAVSLSPATVVVLGAGGLQIPARVGGSPVDLDLTALKTLVALAAPGGTASEPPADGIIARLRQEGLLVTAPPSDRADPEPEPPSDLDAPALRRIAADQRAELRIPIVLRPTGHGFMVTDHDGSDRLALTPAEAHALARLKSSPLLSEIMRTGTAPVDETDAPGEIDPVDPDGSVDLVGLIGRLDHAGFVHVISPTDIDAGDPSAPGGRPRIAAAMGLAIRVEAAVDAHEAEEQKRREATGASRVRVVPVAFERTYVPLALGLITSYAMAYEGGRLNEHYRFLPSWTTDEKRIMRFLDEPGVFLVSNYLWSHPRCLSLSELIKQHSPESVVIHGGPCTPKYRGDVEEYFRRHPYVDVTVRGEGEATTAEILDRLRGALGDGPPDLSCLRGVAGISFRCGDEIVHEPDRDRIADLDEIPSPFLNGLFDAWKDLPDTQVVLETNRGCPYGCTFCDWGSATSSRIRKFDLDRVFAELEWCATSGIGAISVADANFGIWARDLEIAQKVADLRMQYGKPGAFGMSFAKNTVKHLTPIVETLREAGILGIGVLALQSMDQETLDAVERTNIKLDKYEELAQTFRDAGLPLLIELIMGLPGATVASFKDDLQGCIDRDVETRINVAEMLVNSPMNEPSYRERFQIKTKNPVLAAGKSSLVVSTSTFTRDEYDEMDRLRNFYTLCEDFGVLRQIARFVRQESGWREVDLYASLREVTFAEPGRWPTLAIVADRVPHFMAPPFSWQYMIDELHSYLVDVVGVADGDDLETALTVQLAVLPAIGRSFPEVLELPHDYASWWAAIAEQKRAGNLSWPDVVPPLRTFPPGTFRVDDPLGLVTRRLGQPMQFHSLGLNWELASPVTRGMSEEEGKRVEGIALRDAAKAAAASV